MPKLDTMHLEKVGRSYRCQMAVPRHLQNVIGKAKLVKGLRTDSLSKANLLKLNVLHAFRQTLAEAERTLRGQRAGTDETMNEALQWRAAFAQEAAEGDGGPYSPDYVSTALEARYDNLVRAGEKGRAEAIRSVAVSNEMPIAALVEDWLAERAMKPRQVIDSRRAISKLTTWLAAEGRAATIEGVTKRIASDYRMTFIRAGTNPKTANKDISFISSLWKFGERRALVEDNPWRGQSLPKAKVVGAGTANKRPLTDEELSAILSSPHCSPMLKDAVVILALSGMRTEELARLKVGDLKDLEGPIPYIHLRGTKTAAAMRTVPIHKDALPVVLRRAKDAQERGKEADQYVFEELPTPPPDSAMERGQPLTKAFGRLRKRLGIDEREEGARQANVDLHGLRRWFVARARDALNTGATGYTMRTVAETVGHKAEELGLSMTARYAGRESLEAKEACVRAVKLPGSPSGHIRN